MQHESTQRLGSVVPRPVLAAFLTAAIGALATPAASAQVDFASIARQAAGVTEIDGRLVGGGPDYDVRFERGSVVFVPGLAVETGQPAFAFTLESVYRGGELVARAAPGEPAHEGRLVRILYAAGFEERYEVLPEGVEQSFVFPHAPAGAGDLVVRGRVETALDPPAPGWSEDGLRFADGDHGAVTIGAVTGIDARGRKASGRLRYDGTHLELSLPGSFVDRAAWPLVLDPLIGAEILVASAFDESEPALAYDETNDLYLVAWERRIAGGRSDIWAQRVARTGELVGSVIQIDHTPGAWDFHPAVANVQNADRFLVAWMTDNDDFLEYDIVARAVSASTGGLSGRIDVAVSDTVDEVDPVACGEPTTFDDAAFVIYTEEGAGIRAAQVLVPAVGDPSLLGVTVVSTDPEDKNPAVSKSLGQPGRALVLWERWRDGSPGDHDIVGRAIDYTGALLGAYATSIPVSGSNEINPDVDGDGDYWMLVYQKEPSLGDDDWGIYARLGIWFGTHFGHGPEIAVEDDHPEAEVRPVISYAGESYVVAWRDQAGAGQDLQARTLDPEDCGPCEKEVNVDGSGDVVEVRIGSQFSGSLEGDDALIVWDTWDAGSEGNVHAHVWEADIGIVTDRGGGCGEGGVASVSCAVVGNPDFEHRLKKAAAGRPCWLVVAFDELHVPCGACTLVPNPVEAFVFYAGVTTAIGTAEVAMSLPNAPGLVGLTFIDQWVVDSPTSACSWLGAELSNAIEVEIQ